MSQEFHGVMIFTWLLTYFRQEHGANISLRVAESDSHKIWKNISRVYEPAQWSNIIFFSKETLSQVFCAIKLKYKIFNTLRDCASPLLFSLFTSSFSNLLCKKVSEKNCQATNPFVKQEKNFSSLVKPFKGLKGDY